MVDYSAYPEDSDLKVDFPGDRLAEWLAGEGAERANGEDGKPKGVRWSECANHSFGGGTGEGRRGGCC